MTQRVLEWATARLREGESVALASVITSQGSVPGKPGAHMAVTESEVYGTVGGAGLELKVMNHLREILETNEGRIETYQLQKEASGTAGTPLNSLCGGVLTVAMEVIQPMPHILLAGGGHCAQAIADLSAPLGWSVSVLDTRPEYAAEELWPDAEECIASQPEEFLARETTESLARFSHILLLGHDWIIDETLLIGLLERTEGRPRIGCIGSRSKWQAFEKSGLDSGISQETLDTVICPIGVNIGAESPQEIAVAVLAQIIAEVKGVEPASASWRE
ncbi:MAG TPA: XdhC family protein [Candidatus Thalassarchaeaceae archaeon]|jgi:xanthine dehydrogenase accessory factor|nr:XdhC family protein [Candidatus Thalassarchaeaceae archaeon]HJM68206.1 XdhC family protein [Candidatus Thalassarchaeaceae archaeon]